MSSSDVTKSLWVSLRALGKTGDCCYSLLAWRGFCSFRLGSLSPIGGWGRPRLRSDPLYPEKHRWWIMMKLCINITNGTLFPIQKVQKHFPLSHWFMDYRGKWTNLPNLTRWQKCWTLHIFPRQKNVIRYKRYFCVMINLMIEFINWIRLDIQPPAQRQWLSVCHLSLPWKVFPWGSGSKLPRPQTGSSWRPQAQWGWAGPSEPAAWLPWLP